ncbi:MAG: four helix bundle protein [Candidatus Lokiarchaeota archaeon]|nr:four helix bundle protein [Candidatus Lokiarchaeota archaeon]
MKIRSHRELDVFNVAFEAAMEIYNLTKNFPKEEKYSLTDQIKRSSRSVCSNIAEAFRKRKYPKSFVSKLSDSESEAAETQVWLDFSLSCNYIDKEIHKNLNKYYDNIIGKYVLTTRKMVILNHYHSVPKSLSP